MKPLLWVVMSNIDFRGFSKEACIEEAFEWYKRSENADANLVEFKTALYCKANFWMLAAILRELEQANRSHDW